MGKGRYCYSEVLPFAAMVLIQCVQVGQSTLFKAAASAGMSYVVFIVYSHSLSGLILLPFAAFFHRKDQLPKVNLSIVGRICLLGLLGFTAQMTGYQGIEYSSPTLASAISNLTPAYTFVLAIVFGMEKLEIKRLSSQAKILGTVVSILGALVVVLYKGPTVIHSGGSTSSILVFRSTESNWALGGGLLVIDYLVLSTWYIVQVQTVEKYPSELLVVSLYNLSVGILATPVSLVLEPDLSAWKISSHIMLIALLFAGLFGLSFATVILTWGLRLKGPVYVALFTPLSIVIAAVMGVIFLGDSLYLGCIVGAIILSFGFYVVMWGKAKEETPEDAGATNLLQEEPSPETISLL